MTVTDDKFDEAKNALQQEILKAVSIKDNGTSINSNKAKVDLNKIQNADGTYDVTISYKGMNGKTVSKTVKVTVQTIVLRLFAVIYVDRMFLPVFPPLLFDCLMIIRYCHNFILLNCISCLNTIYKIN